MKIIRAKHYWFCWWVERAYEMVEKSLEKNWKVKVWWELIHNKPAINLLEKKGMQTVEKFDEISWNVIIRSHWISKKKMNEIKKRAKSVKDATCPYVTNIHIIAKRFFWEGRKIIIIWDGNHPEMKWVSEDFEVFCVLNKKDVENLWNFEKVWVVVQTTLKKDTFDELSKELKKKYKNIKISNTICSATTERQDAVKELSKICDFILVIWWINSSNSKKLQEIALEKCDSEKVETFWDIKKEWFIWKEIIWITAWASTPEWLINEIEEGILKMFSK